MISAGKPSNYKGMFTNKVSEADVLGHYLGIKSIPCLIISPFRLDTKPSLAFYSPDGIHINYIDFGDMQNRGSFMTFFMKLWKLDYNSTIDKIVKEVVKRKNVAVSNGKAATVPKVKICGKTELQCTVRSWEKHDIDYWKSYGIPLSLLKWAEVYPISHKIIKKDNKTMVFPAERYCYTFVERKDGRITHKFYQPFNTNGYKWQNNHDKSVLGLWTKLPEEGEQVCICSSVKDALCLISNMHIPCICLQGEGYPISNTAATELKRRFNYVFVCLDNDEPGKLDAFKLSQANNFINVQIPPFEGGKDISDYYKVFGEEKFKSTFSKIFIEAQEEWLNTLPF